MGRAMSSSDRGRRSDMPHGAALPRTFTSLPLLVVDADGVGDDCRILSA